MKAFRGSACHLASGILLLAGIAVGTGNSQENDRSPETIVQENADRFAEAFNRGDAEGVAAFWAEEGTWSDPAAGVRIEGREALEESYGSFFEENPGTQLQLQVESVRVVSETLAIEEGRATIVSPGEIPSVSAYTVIHQKSGDDWLMEHVVESQLPEQDEEILEGLQEIAWLEGEWIDETESSAIHYVNSWAANGRYLRREFTVYLEDVADLNGVEVVGWDPVEEQIRSWVFDSEGGFAELFWRKGEGDGVWVKTVRATLVSGEQSTAVHVLTRKDDNTYTFKSVARQRDGQPLPNIDEVTVVRLD